jgi:hypothetical protein
MPATGPRQINDSGDTVTLRLRVSVALAAIAALGALGLVAGAPAAAAPAHLAGGHLPASALRIRPDNAPCPCNHPVVEPEDDLSQYGWINHRTGVLTASGNNDTEFSFRSNNELEIFTGKYAGDCLYYDHDASDFDAKACNATKLSDLWKFGVPGHTYSEWQSYYGKELCVWYAGKGRKMHPRTCAGTKAADHWYWVVPTCQPYCSATLAGSRPRASDDVSDRAGWHDAD